MIRYTQHGVPEAQQETSFMNGTMDGDEQGVWAYTLHLFVDIASAESEYDLTDQICTKINSGEFFVDIITGPSLLGSEDLA